MCVNTCYHICAYKNIISNFNLPKPDYFQLEVRCVYVIPVALPNVFPTKFIQFLFTDTIIELVKIVQTLFRSKETHWETIWSFGRYLVFRAATQETLTT